MGEGFPEEHSLAGAERMCLMGGVTEGKLAAI